MNKKRWFWGIMLVALTCGFFVPFVLFGIMFGVVGFLLCRVTGRLQWVLDPFFKLLQSSPRHSPLRLLLGLHLTQLWRKLRDANKRSGSLTWLIIGFVATYPIIASWLFFHGLNKLARVQGIGPVLIEELVFLLFAFLFMMLLFSNVVVGYTNLFRNKESVFLFTQPISASSIFRWKFIESTCIASWAFLLLVAPLLAAYGMQQKADWHFYFLTPVLVGLFIILPAVLGCWTAILLARYLDRRLFQISGVLIAITIVLALRAYMQPEIVADESLVIDASEERARLLSKTRFVQFPFMPSYWLSRSMTEWKDGVFDLSIFYLLVLLSNVLFFGLLAFTRTGRYFYDALSATLSRGSLMANWPELLNQAGRACAALAVLSFFLPYLSLQNAFSEARNGMTQLREETAQAANQHAWPTLRAGTTRANQFSTHITVIFDQLAQHLGTNGLGRLGATRAQLEGARPAFAGLPVLVDHHLSFVDLKPVEAEFSLRIRDYFQANLSGWALARGAKPITKPGRPQPVPLPVVTAVAISPDGESAAAAWPGMVKLFETEDTDTTPAALTTPLELVTHLGFSPNGQWLAFVGIMKNQRGLVQFRTPSGELKHEVETSAQPLCAAFSPDNQTLAIGQSDGSIWLIPVSSPNKPRIFLKHHHDRITALSWSSDGQRLFSASMDKQSKVTAVNKKASNPLTLDLGSTALLVFDGQKLISGDQLRTLTVRNPTNGEILATSPRFDTGTQIGSIHDHKTLSNNTRTIVAGDFPGVYIIDNTDLSVVQTLTNNLPEINTAIDSDAEGTRIILGGRNGAVQVHDLQDRGTQLRPDIVAETPPPPAKAGAPRPLLFLIPLAGLAAMIINRPVAYLIGGLMPFAVLTWLFVPSGMPSPGLLGVGLWLALLAGLGQLACLTQFWENTATRLETKKQEHFRHGPLDRLVGALPLLASDTRALLLKDTRAFWRDTTQWGQALMFFGITGLYFMNMHYLIGDPEELSKFYKNLTKYMNFATCALNLAVLTTRFVYPQFSLEGKRIWIIGLAPMGLARVVLVKMTLATAASLLLTLPLIWLSCHMLKLSGNETLYFAFAITLMALTLNSLAIGMGVLYPNLKEDNPSKIVSSFGGTFSLVLSFVYIGAGIMFIGMASPWSSPWNLLGTPPPEKRLLSFAGFLLLSFLLGVAPLLHARKKATKMEH